MIADVSAARGNLIIAQVGRRGDAYYRESYQPRTDDPALSADFDALRYLIDKAHAATPRIEVHAWLSTCLIWSTWLGKSPANPDHVFNLHGISRAGRNNWLTRRIDGAVVAGTDYWLDPGHPDAVDYIVRMYAFVAANYDLDGIHLDRVRYPEARFRDPVSAEWGYNETAVERFRTMYTRRGLPDPDDPEWITFRREALRALVRKIYLICTAINLNLKVSASTVAFGAGPTNDAEYEQTRTYRQVLQDPVGWLQEGILDVNMPMNYDREADGSQRTWFEDWIRFEKDRAGGRHVVPATAPYLNSVSESVAQIRKVLSANPNGNTAAGVAGFSYQSPAIGSRSFSDLIRALTKPSESDPRRPLFEEPVETPQATWKTSPTRGLLMGWATGTSGAYLDGAEVKVEGPESRALRSDGNGWFGAVGLLPGDYELTIPKAGVLKHIRIDAGSIALIWDDRLRREPGASRERRSKAFAPGDLFSLAWPEGVRTPGSSHTRGEDGISVRLFAARGRWATPGIATDHTSLSLENILPSAFRSSKPFR